MSDNLARIYDFGCFRLDTRERQLLREGCPLPLTAKAFDTLLVLVERSGHLIEKQDLMDLVWGESFVEEGNLTVIIHTLRKVLGDDEVNRRYIQTVAKRGYRFVAEVREIPSVDHAPEAAVDRAGPAPQPWLSFRLAPRLGAFLLALVIILTGVIHLARKSAASDEAAPIRSIAVLPFRPLNLGVDQQYVGLGMVDEVITRLGSSGTIAVRPTSSILKYSQSSPDPVTAGREQRVDAVVEGNVEFLSGQVRISVQLVRVRDGFVLWADSFKEESGHMSALEEEVAEGIEHSLPVRSSDRTRLRKPHADPPSPEAYQLYLHGLYYWDKRTESDVHESINYFQKAIAIDPQYALAYASLANAYVVLGSYGEAPWQVYPQAKATALKAVELDDTLAAAHASLAMVAMHYEWNWTDAKKEFEQSIALNPNDSAVRVWYATHLAAMGHYDEAIAEGHRAEELDPLSPAVNTTVSRILYWNRDYDRAISGFDKVIELSPNFAAAHIRCGVAFLAKHDPQSALLQFEEARRISGGGPYLDGLVGYAQAVSGDSRDARETLKNLLRRSRIQYVPAFSVAMVYIGLGERESALDWLERAYQDHSSYMVYAKTDPLLDPVRSNPRFSALLNQMGLSR